MRYFPLLDAIMTHGTEITTRGLVTRELNNVVLNVDNYNAVSVPGCRDWEDVSKYLFAEMAWYMSGDRNIEKILPHSKFWANIVNPDGKTINSNYGDLVFYRTNQYGYTSFEWAKKMLEEDKYTRKALVLYNDRCFFFPENRDLICNQYQHFMIRDGKLDCTVCLRSSDAIFGLTFNIPWWSLVHQQMHLWLLWRYPELKLGKITAFISSSHIYQNKFELVEKMLDGSREYRFLELLSPLPLHRTMEEYRSLISTHLVLKDIYEA